MNENLILEGNTIYELDPICMRTKRNFAQRQTAGDGRMTTIAGRECCGNKKECPCCAVFCAALLVGCRMKCR